MNDLDRFNDTLNYIEENLDGDLSDAAIAHIACCPAALFGRIFSVLGGLPLGEYIRLRRLSRAALDLRQPHLRVIDVAVKYGYESEDAFAAAFKRFHGISPGAARKEGSVRVLPPIRFTLRVQGGNHMNVRIEKRGPFQIAGITLRGTPEADFTDFWHQLFSRYDMQQLMALGDGQSYGACYDMGEDGTFHYMAGTGCADAQAACDIGPRYRRLPTPLSNCSGLCRSASRKAGPMSGAPSCRSRATGMQARQTSSCMPRETCKAPTTAWNSGCPS